MPSCHWLYIMILEKALKLSESWMIKRIKIIDRLYFDPSRNLQVAVSLLMHSVDTHSAVHTLIRNGVISPAYALIRPQLEAYVRGSWFARCASDEQISSFIAGKEPPKINTLIFDIKSVCPELGGRLEKNKCQIWKKLNDLTHGGIIQVKGRCTNSGIKQNFPKQDIANLLTGSATMSLLASQELVEITNNYPIVEQLHQSFGELFAEYVTGSAGSEVAS